MRKKLQFIITHNSSIAEAADKVIEIYDAKVKKVTQNTNPKSIDEIEWQCYESNKQRYIKRNIKNKVEVYIDNDNNVSGSFYLCRSKETSPAMVNTYNKYIERHKMYDLRVSHNFGINEEDMKIINSLDNVDLSESYFIKKLPDS